MDLISHLTPVRALKIQMSFRHWCEKWTEYSILAHCNCFAQLICDLMRNLWFKVETFNFAWCTTAYKPLVLLNSFFVNDVVECLRSFALVQRTKTTYTAVDKSFYWCGLQICLFDSLKHRLFISLKIVDPFFDHHWNLACLGSTQQKIGAFVIFEIDSCQLITTSYNKHDVSCNWIWWDNRLIFTGKHLSILYQHVWKFKNEKFSIL